MIFYRSHIKSFCINDRKFKYYIGKLFAVMTIWSTFKITNLKEYVELCADVFKNSNICIANSNLIWQIIVCFQFISSRYAYENSNWITTANRYSYGYVYREKQLKFLQYLYRKTNNKYIAKQYNPKEESSYSI